MENLFDNEQFISSLFAFTLQPDVAVVITVYISTRHKLAYGIRANVYAHCTA